MRTLLLSENETILFYLIAEIRTKLFGSYNFGIFEIAFTKAPSHGHIVQVFQFNLIVKCIFTFFKTHSKPNLDTYLLKHVK